jgi:hypothetical protein
MAVGYEVDDRGFKFRQWMGVFVFTTASRPVLGPPIQYVSGALSQGVK